MSYWEKENECERRFLNGGPFFIVSTENLSWLLFTCDRDFMDGTNMVAVAFAGLVQSANCEASYPRPAPGRRAADEGRTDEQQQADCPSTLPAVESN